MREPARAGLNACALVCSLPARLKDEEFLVKRKVELERKGINRGAAKEFKQEYVRARGVGCAGGWPEKSA